MRIEHTSGFDSRRTVLKTVPNTSPDCLPSNIVSAPHARRCGQPDDPVTLGTDFLHLTIPRSSNGRTAAFGAVNRGSNPCRGARSRTHLSSGRGTRRRVQPPDLGPGRTSGRVPYWTLRGRGNKGLCSPAAAKGETSIRIRAAPNYIRPIEAPCLTPIAFFTGAVCRGRARGLTPHCPARSKTLRALPGYTFLSTPSGKPKP